MQKREFVHICVLCDPISVNQTVNERQLELLTQQHRNMHGLNGVSRRIRVVQMLTSPQEETDTPEIGGILEWDSYERARRSKINLAQEGPEGSGG